jgi:hypothetical protein
MNLDQALAAAGPNSAGTGNEVSSPTTTPDYLYALTGQTVSCVGTSLGQSSGTQTVSTPEGFHLGDSVQTLLSIYGSRAKYIPFPSGYGIDPSAGYIVAETGGNLFFFIDQQNASVNHIIGGPNVSGSNSCSG